MINRSSSITYTYYIIHIISYKLLGSRYIIVFFYYPDEGKLYYTKLENEF